MTGCKKNNNVNSYSFQYTLNGNQYVYNSQELKTGNNGYNSLGGLIVQNSDTSFAAGINVNFGNDSATGTNILALAGKTFSFNPNSYPKVSIDIVSASYNYENLFTNNSTYYAAISSVNFLRYDTSAGYDIYVVKGTFTAKIWDVSGGGDTIGDATNGSFDIQCSANHFN